MSIKRGIVLAVLLAVVPVAFSENNSSENNSSENNSSGSDSAESVSNLIVLEESAINAEGLSAQSGKSDLNLQFQINDSDQNALLQDNSLSNAVTGDNSIADNALSGMSGISTVIQNTGNQVIIQGSTLVNVVINK